MALSRVRWAALGAACAVAIGGGGLGVLQAIPSSNTGQSSFVPISPYRILDTRHDVGLSEIRHVTPAKLTVTGSIATTEGVLVVVPTGASAVSVNVTAVNPTADGWIALEPGGAKGEPKVSTLNVTRGGTFPNAATVTLPTSGADVGKLRIYYFGSPGATTELLIDVVGYYTDVAQAVYTKPEVDAMIASAIAGIPTNDGYTRSETDQLLSDLADGLVDDVSPIRQREFVSTRVLDSGSRQAPLGESSVVVIADYLPVIAYTDFDQRAVKIASCNDPDCRSASVRFIEPSMDSNGEGSDGIVGIVNEGGNPVFAYSSDGYIDLSNDNVLDGVLHVAACSDPSCNGEILVTDINLVAPDWSRGFVMTRDSNGYPAIAYVGGVTKGVQMIVCSTEDCSTGFTQSTIASGLDYRIGGIANAGNGVLQIVYVEAPSDQYDLNLFTGSLELATCTAPCSSPSVVELDASIEVGRFAPLIDSQPFINGQTLVVYRDTNDTAPTFVNCPNHDCTMSESLTWDEDLHPADIVSFEHGFGPTGYQLTFYSPDGNSYVTGVCFAPCNVINEGGVLRTTSNAAKASAAVKWENGRMTMVAFDPNSPGITVVTSCVGMCLSLNSQVSKLDADSTFGYMTGHLDSTIGMNSHPIFTYFDQESGGLIVNFCQVSDCSVSNRRHILKAFNAVRANLALRPSGLPVIAFSTQENDGSEKTYIAECSQSDCAGRIRLTQIGAAFDDVDIEILQSGQVVVGYIDEESQLWLALCDPDDCRERTFIPVRDAVDHFDMAIGNDGSLAIVTSTSPRTTIDVVKCSNLACDGLSDPISIMTSDSYGADLSMILGVDGFPVIALPHPDDGILVVQCDSWECSNGLIRTISSGSVGGPVAMSLDRDGRLAMTFYDSVDREWPYMDRFNYVRCAETICENTDEPQILDVLGNVDNEANRSLVLAGDGSLVAAYSTELAWDIKIAVISRVG